MKTAPVAEVKAKLSAYTKASENGPIVVTPRAVAVPITPDSEGIRIGKSLSCAPGCPVRWQQQESNCELGIFARLNGWCPPQ